MAMDLKWAKARQPELRQHVVQEITELQNLVKGYKRAITEHPEHHHENQLMYIEKFVNRILYSIHTYY